MEVNGQLHAQAALLSGKSPRFKLDRRPGGPISQSGRSGEDRKSPSSQCWESNPGCRARSIVSILTKLTTGASEPVW